MQAEEKAQIRAELKKAFDETDVDNNGVLTVEDLRQICETKGYHSPDKDLEQTIADFDHNEDGKVTFEEFALKILGE